MKSRLPALIKPFSSVREPVRVDQAQEGVAELIGGDSAVDPSLVRSARGVRITAPGLEPGFYRTLPRLKSKKKRFG